MKCDARINYVSRTSPPHCQGVTAASLPLSTIDTQVFCTLDSLGLPFLLPEDSALSSLLDRTQAAVSLGEAGGN